MSNNRQNDFEFAHILLDAANMLTGWAENNRNRNPHGEEAAEMGRKILKRHAELLASLAEKV